MSYKWLVVLLLAGCGASTPGNAWQARVPVYLNVTDEVPADLGEVKLSLASGLAQFGFTTSISSWGQTLTVRYDDKCHCRSCVTGQVQNLATTAAYVSQSEYHTIYICPAFARVQDDFGLAAALDMVLKHELGHALGLVNHLEPAPGVLMSAQIDWRPTVRSFGPTDIAQICAAGGVRSPVCD